ncbi:hypothetical protein [Chryseobacterium sp. SORGH_AS_1175]|nr:hypothetical protein [Chryseobacterium sp. SORGH_AS_1175]
MEKQNAGNTSSKENWRLFMHLKICKWCMAYKKKLELLDEILKGKLFNEQKNEIKEFEIQGFKEKNLKKLDI